MVALSRKATAFLAVSCSIALSIPSVSAAQDNAEMASSSQTKRIVSQRLAQSVTALEKSMAECERQEVSIPPEKFEDVRLSDEQLLIALQFFARRANNECISHEASRFAVAAKMARRAGIRPIGAGSFGEDVEVENLVIQSLWDEIELQIRYKELPAEGRSDLKEIDALQKPFDILSTAEQAGLA